MILVISNVYSAISNAHRAICVIDASPIRAMRVFDASRTAARATSIVQ